MLALLLLRETLKLFPLRQKPHEHLGGLQGRGASDTPHAPGKKREREREREGRERDRERERVRERSLSPCHSKREWVGLEARGR